MIALFLIAVASARTDFGQTGRTTTAEDYWAQWKEFQTEHGKNYLSSIEHDRRFDIFMDNIDKINRHNAKDLTWKMGVTPFADLTADEFKNKTRCMGIKRDHGENVKVLDTSNLADSVDWDAEGKVTPVKNQGQCGSCWAFSTTGAVESRYAISKGTLTPLSEQELIDCDTTKDNGCNGGLMDYGFEYVQTHGGLCSETEYPYEAKDKPMQCISQTNGCTKHDQISGHQDVQAYNMEQLMAAVSQGPVSIAIEADQSAFQLYRSGVFTGTCGARLDHGVLVVGYGTDTYGGDFWKVKNSWGPGWGENGYIRLCKNCGKNSSFFHTAGQCGILASPSYPIV